jgi:hypothetical protein
MGWRVAHFRTVRVQRGNSTHWETPVAADGKGFPDLVLVRDRVLFVELKLNTTLGKAGKKGLSEDQKDWHVALLKAGAEFHLWKPSDWPEIEKVLAVENRT